uniref:Tyrosine-protein kinase n=1 Tax=Saccoglossus kowalevskii TaxID=10224 RepID=A0ABM0MES4_SACKO|nr:PREDICTED: tyrosine-protein kinase Fer-like [Saccoglossus kowalevskii]
MKDEVTENFIKYQKIARDARDTKAKYDEAVSKGKSDKDLMKLKDKYRKNTVRLHKVHNDYVVSIHTAQTHQEHYKEVVLPRLLDAHQQAEESYVSQVKQLLTHYAGLTNTSNLDYQNMNENLLQGIRNIQPTEEYVAFIDANKGAEEWVNIEFDHRVNDDYTDAYLKTSDIAMDNLTYEDITHKCTEVSELLEKCKEDIKKKEDALAVLDVEIKSISPTEAQDSMIQELLSKQREYRECFKSIGLLQCDEAKLSVQLELFHQKITELGDATPHSGIDFNTSEVDLTKNKNDSMDKGKKLKKPKTLFKKNKSNVSEVHIPEEEGEEYSEIAMQKSLTDEDWYHGCIPRPEAVTLLEKDGQFLVRQKGDDSGQIVLSVKWEGKHKHFPIQKNAEGQFRLEGDNYGTVSELIEYQMKTHKPVTKLSGAILLSFIQRHWDLTHDDIEIAEFLGKGNFGDVMKGYLKKDRTPVAVKTCKENVDPIIRQKFLMEARILKQYDHKNIVKLVGVCTERQPVYIVMEFIAGGDFLNFLRNQGGSMSIPQLVRMSENAAAGMAYLSSKKCIHRDLAARNCLVGDNNIVKISDFGMSRQEEDGLYMVSGGMKQIPIKWTAPEAMNYGEYTIECDVWSYGILLWEIFSRGNIPYPGMNNATAREKIENGYRMSAPDGTPNEIHELMLECWKYHPQDRITFEQIHRTLVRLCKVIK